MTKQKSVEEIKADYNLFINIQMGKYFKLMNKAEFDSDEEAKRVLGKIVDEYNNSIAGEHARLDQSDLTAKTFWFNSVNIDFEKVTDLKSILGKIPVIQAKKRRDGFTQRRAFSIFAERCYTIFNVHASGI